MDGLRVRKGKSEHGLQVLESGSFGWGACLQSILLHAHMHGLSGASLKVSEGALELAEA
jgi:hypothetical protein